MSTSDDNVCRNRVCVFMEDMKKNSIVANDFRQKLRSELELRVRRNPSYSVRAFARALDLDASALSKLLAGKRPLGKKLISRLGEKMGLSDKEIEKYIQAQQVRKKLNTLNVDKLTAQFKLLSAAEISSISHWYHYAILEVMDLKSFSSDLSWISKVLDIPLSTAELAIKQLAHVGLVERNENGQWFKTSLKTTSDPSQEETKAIRERLMKEIFENSRNALDRITSSQRTHTAMTFAGDSSLLAEAAEKIRAFRAELADFLNRNSEKRDHVFQLTVALFPLTKMDG